MGRLQLGGDDEQVILARLRLVEAGASGWVLLGIQQHGFARRDKKMADDHVVVILDVYDNKWPGGLVHHFVEVVGAAGQSAGEGKQGDR
jgi:hypothetical protein